MNLKSPVAIHYYPKLNLNFWAITKCASTTLRTYFRLLEEPGLTKKEIIDRWGVKAHASLGTNKYLVDLDNLKGRSVAVIRHPIARFRSMFADLLRKRFWRGKGAGLREDMSVSDLADYVTNTDDTDLDIHLKPQVCFLDSSQDIEFMRLENLENDWLFDFPAPSYRLHKTSSDFELPEIVSDKVCKRYKEDLFIWNERKMK